MKEEKYVITYLDEKGDLQTIERTETEEELRERIKCYRRHNYKVKSVVKEIVTISYARVDY